MKRQFFEAIVSGAKTTTLRYWQSQRVRAGSLHTVPALGKVRVVDVRTIRLMDISDDDARRDGFSDARQLRRALKAMYPPHLRRSRQLYLVSFQYVPKDRKRKGK